MWHFTTSDKKLGYGKGFVCCMLYGAVSVAIECLLVKHWPKQLNEGAPVDVGRYLLCAALAAVVVGLVVEFIRI
jgi:hypothetical protein